MRDRLLNLPPEVIDHILVGLLALPDVLALQQCSRELLRVFSHRGVWRSLLGQLSQGSSKRTRRSKKDLEQTKRHIKDKWTAVVIKQRIVSVSALKALIDSEDRCRIHLETLKMLRLLEAQSMIRLSALQSRCHHLWLLFLYLRPTPFPPRAVRRTGLACSVCGAECLGELNTCSVCEVPSSSSRLSATVACRSCRSPEGHRGHPVATFEPAPYSAEYCCGCLVCGVSCVARLSSLLPCPSPAMTISFVCLSSQNLFRGVTINSRREELLERRRSIDLLIDLR